MNTVTFFKITNITEEAQQEAILLDLLEFMSEDELEANIVYDAGYSGTAEHELVFAFVTDVQAEKIKTVFENHNILVMSDDITADVLMGDFESNKKWQELFDQESIMNFKPTLDQFLLNNLTKDMVLDKITEKGMDALSVIDFQVLNA
jgi:hypothetical protein